MGFNRRRAAVLCLCPTINFSGLYSPTSHQAEMRHGAQEDGSAHTSSASWTDQTTCRVCTKASPRSGVAELGGTEPPQKVPQRCSCSPRQAAQVPRPRVGWKQGPVLPREGVCTPVGYRLHQGSVTALPQNTCSLVNPGSAYLKGHIRQLAYLL